MAKPAKARATGDDDTESPSEDEANRRAIERVRQAQRDAGGDEPGPFDGEDLEVGGDDDDFEDEPGQQAGSRAERRRERGHIHRALQEERQRRAELERQVHERDERYARELAELRARTAAPAAPAAAEPDPLETEQRAVRAEYEAWAVRWNAAVQRNDQAALEKLREEGYQIKDRWDLNTHKRAMKQMGVQPGGGAVGPEQIRAQMTRARLEQDHGDVVSDQRRMAYFMGEMQRRVAVGEPDDWDTVSKAMDETRRAFRLPPRGGRPPASEATRRRHGGMPRGSSAPSAPAENKLRVSTEERKHIERQANELYKHLPKEKRLETYLKKVGPRVAERLRKEGLR